MAELNDINRRLEEAEQQQTSQARQNLENARREHLSQQKKLEELNNKLESSSNEMMTESLKKRIEIQRIPKVNGIIKESRS